MSSLGLLRSYSSCLFGELSSQSLVFFLYFAWEFCLVKCRKTSPKEGEKCSVAGFGDTTGADHYSNVLNEGILTIDSYKYCNLIYGNDELSDGSSFFCAQNFTFEIDTCQGDSGGPLTCSRKGTSYMFGITSFGVGCNDQRYPGAYTAVASYLDWVNEIKVGDLIIYSFYK